MFFFYSTGKLRDKWWTLGWCLMLHPPAVMVLHIPHPQEEVLELPPQLGKCKTISNLNNSETNLLFFHARILSVHLNCTKLYYYSKANLNFKNIYFPYYFCLPIISCIIVPLNTGFLNKPHHKLNTWKQFNSLRWHLCEFQSKLNQ